MGSLPAGPGPSTKCSQSTLHHHCQSPIWERSHLMINDYCQFIIWEYFLHYCIDFYRTQVQSLPTLVSYPLTDALTIMLLRLDWSLVDILKLEFCPTDKFGSQSAPTLRKRVYPWKINGWKIWWFLYIPKCNHFWWSKNFPFGRGITAFVRNALFSWGPLRMVPKLPLSSEM